MGADVRIRPATRRDVFDLAPRIRPADQREAWRALGVRTELALEMSFNDSALARVAEQDGRAIAMWGVIQGSPLTRNGIVWMTGSAEATADRRLFLRYSRWEVQELLQLFPYLWNRVDATYTAAIRWLERIGFHVEPPEPSPATGAPMRTFWAGRA